MRRGETWVGAGAGDYLSKPRPVLVVQSNRFDNLASVIVCPITSTDDGGTLMRPMIEPDGRNGLAVRSWIMVEKVGAIRRGGFRQQLGLVSPDIMDRVSAELAALLGFD